MKDGAPWGVAACLHDPTVSPKKIPSCAGGSTCLPSQPGPATSGTAVAGPETVTLLQEVQQHAKRPSLQQQLLLPPATNPGPSAR